MRRLVVAWLAFWAGAGLLFYVADRRGVALCKATRCVFRTHTPAGRLVFRLAYRLGAAVLEAHILRAEAHVIDRTIRALDASRPRM